MFNKLLNQNFGYNCPNNLFLDLISIFSKGRIQRNLQNEKRTSLFLFYWFFKMIANSPTPFNPTSTLLSRAIGIKASGFKSTLIGSVLMLITISNQPGWEAVWQLVIHIYLCCYSAYSLSCVFGGLVAGRRTFNLKLPGSISAQHPSHLFFCNSSGFQNGSMQGDNNYSYMSTYDYINIILIVVYKLYLNWVLFFFKWFTVTNKW